MCNESLWSLQIQNWIIFDRVLEVNVLQRLGILINSNDSIAVSIFCSLMDTMDFGTWFNVDWTCQQGVFSDAKSSHIWLICWVRQYRVTLLSPLLRRAFIWRKTWNLSSLPIAWRFDKFSVRFWFDTSSLFTSNFTRNITKVVPEQKCLHTYVFTIFLTFLINICHNPIENTARNCMIVHPAWKKTWKQWICFSGLRPYEFFLRRSQKLMKSSPTIWH